MEKPGSHSGVDASLLAGPPAVMPRAPSQGPAQVTPGPLAMLVRAWSLLSSRSITGLVPLPPAASLPCPEY